MKNYYEILEVNKNASSETISRIFKYHIKKSHPDLFTGDEKEKAKLKVQELNEAYEVLSNDKKRKEYDILLLEEEQKNDNLLNNYNLLIEENEILREELTKKNELLNSLYSTLNINNYDDNNSINNNNNTKNLQNETATNYFGRVFKNFIFKIILILACFILLLILTSILIDKNLFSSLFAIIFNIKN